MREGRQGRVRATVVGLAFSLLGQAIWGMSLPSEWPQPCGSCPKMGGRGAEKRWLTLQVHDSLNAASKAVLLGPSGPEPRTRAILSAAESQLLPSRYCCRIKSRPSVKSFKALGLSLLLSPDPGLCEANLGSCYAHNTAVPTLCLCALVHRDHVPQEVVCGDSGHTA